MSCTTCGRFPAAFRCSGCHKATYCSKKCQKLDFLFFEHKCGRKKKLNKITIIVDPETHRKRYEITNPDVIAPVPVGDAFTMTKEVEHACMIPGKRWGIARGTPLFDPFVKLEQYFPPIKHLGTGGYGSVYSMNIDTGIVAVKFMDYEKEGDFPNSALREIEARNIDHKNVMGICRAFITTSPEDVSKRAFALVMDKVKGSVEGLIPWGSPSFSTPHNMMSILYKMALGVAHVNWNLILHGDIKPGNFLVYGEKDPISGKIITEVAIADLGVARGRFVAPVDSDFAYTVNYKAPELIFSDQKFLSYAAEVWALGCCFYEAAMGERMFEGKTEKEVGKRIVDLFGVPSAVEKRALYAKEPRGIELSLYEISVATRLFDIYGKAGTMLSNLLAKMLRWHPLDRITIFDVVKDPFFDTVRSEGTYADEHSFSYPDIIYEKPSLAIAPVSIIPRLRDKLGHLWLDRSPLSNIELSILCTVGKYIFEITKRIPSKMEALFTSFMILSCYMEAVGPSEIATPIAGEVMAIVCHIIGLKYASSLQAPKLDLYTRYFPSVTKDMILALETQVLMHMDFDVTIPTAYDFIHAYSRLNKITTNRETTLLCIVAISFSLNMDLCYLDPDTLGKLVVWFRKLDPDLLLEDKEKEKLKKLGQLATNAVKAFLVPKTNNLAYLNRLFKKVDIAWAMQQIDPL